jgi:ATP-dependent RNA helicase RhlE
MNSFSDFGLLATLCKTLKEKRLFNPTEIQTRAIPLLLSEKSVVGISETGSGKTLAYALPVLHLLKTQEAKGQPVTAENTPRAIVMVPTRDLGEQVSKVFKTLTHDTRLRVRPSLGGTTFEQARRNVSGAFEILIATPGRLVQLIDHKLIQLNDVRMLIFDEADQMLDQGFLPDSNLIVASCPPQPQMALFSATISPSVQELMNTLFSSAEVLRSAGSGKVVKSLITKNMTVVDGKRWPLFEKILAQPVKGGTLVFTNTREQCDKLAKELTDKGFLCGIYRGEMEPNVRRQNLKKFREGKVDLLVSTDLAGRGLDLEQVGRVINYHLPQQMENYLHRVGRTARAGRSGLVVNLVTERDLNLISQLEGKKPVARPQSPRTKPTAPVARKKFKKPTRKGR